MDTLAAFSAWFEGHPGLAGWFQGCGTVIAILSGFAVAARQNRSARQLRDREHRDRGYAIALLIRDDLVTLRAKLGAAKELSWHDVTPASALYSAVATPDTINRNLGDLYLLGTAGHSVLRMVSVLISNYEMINDAAQRHLVRADMTALPRTMTELSDRGFRAAATAEQDVKRYLNEME